MLDLTIVTHVTVERAQPCGCNYPPAASKPLCGVLTTGQRCLIGNNHQERRALLSIAVMRPSGFVPEGVWRIRRQKWPKRRLLSGHDQWSKVGQPTQWSHPSAVERDGKLFWPTHTERKTRRCCLFSSALWRCDIGFMS